MTMEFCDKHSTKWDPNKFGDCPVCYAETHVGGSKDKLDWHAVALMLGERLCDSGPAGYYDMKPYQWLEWGDKQVQNRFRELLQQRTHAPRSPKAAAAAARVLAGERKAAVSRDTGVSRSTIDRHLAALRALEVLAPQSPVDAINTGNDLTPA